MSFDHDMEQIEELVARFESCSDPALKKDAQTLLAAVLQVHRHALVKLLQAIDNEAIAALKEDAALDTILSLHDLTLSKQGSSLRVLP